MRAALGAQPLRGALEHQSGRSGEGAQHAVVGFAQHPGVDMRQQAGLGQHQLGAVADIIDGAGEAALLQPFLRDGIAPLGRVPQSEQRFLTAR